MITNKSKMENVQMNYYAGLPGFVMSLIYLSVGLVLILSENVAGITGIQKNGLALLIFIYGSFRMYRFLKNRKEESDDEDQE